MSTSVPHFDATARRRQKMRQKAGTAETSGPPATSSGGNGADAEPVPIVPKPVRDALGFLARAPGMGEDATGTVPQRTSPRPVPASRPPLPQAAASASRETSAVAPSPRASVPHGGAVNPKELETFLVGFVVEQTGYPASIVELDADLEADLGIDSIKKAQLFGELGQRFQVKPSADLSLDDFPTLRHVLNYLAANVGTVQAGAAPAPEPARNVSAPAPRPPAATARTVSRIAPAAPLRTAEPGAVPAGAALRPEELESFLVNFVVEQTGYPASIVELDADLEADLGIDSIKKAQLFGELGQRFQVKPSADLSLDDFPTLRHVLNYLLAGSGTPAAGASSVKVRGSGSSFRSP
jgi:acyl carrier protein